MGGSYRQCTECGKRALSIATRCPGCGREFPAPAAPDGGGAGRLGRLVTPRAAAILAVVAVLALARFGPTRPSQDQPAAFIAAESVADFSEVGFAKGTTAPLETAAAGARPGASGPELHVSRSWTNVRRSRSAKAPLEAMLLPGDTVVADSLELGWYRVALEGEVLGYAHQSTIEILGR